ncbi:MAG: TolC family protein [Balneolaceae bacterium]|nr:TolC family protein [Balneolaceae bacterium]
MNFKKTLITLYIYLILIACTIQPVKAQAFLTLNEAIEAGLEYNHTVRISSMDKEIAKNLATRGNAGLLPIVGFAGEAGQSYGAVDLTPGSFFRDLIGGQGGQLPSEISYNGVSSAEVNAGVSAEMVLYNGRAGEARYRLLHIGKEAASVQYQHKMEQTILDITGAYIQSAILQESLKLKKEMVEQSQNHYHRFEQQRRFGQASGQQLLQAQKDLKRDSTAYRDLEQQYQNSWRELHHAIGWDLSEPFDLEANFPVEFRFDIHQLTENARKENRVLQLAKLQTEMSDAETDLARSAYLPTLAASARYGYKYQYASEGQFETQEWLGVTGGLTLRVPIFQGGRSSTGVQNARIERRQKEIEKTRAEDQIVKNVENVLDRFHHLKNQLETEQTNLSVYERNYERAVHANRQGLISGIEMSHARLSLHESRMQIAKLSLQLKLEETRLLYLSGGLLVLGQRPDG